MIRHYLARFIAFPLIVMITPMLWLYDLIERLLDFVLDYLDR